MHESRGGGRDNPWKATLSRHVPAVSTVCVWGGGEGASLCLSVTVCMHGRREGVCDCMCAHVCMCLTTSATVTVCPYAAKMPSASQASEMQMASYQCLIMSTQSSVEGGLCLFDRNNGRLSCALPIQTLLQAGELLDSWGEILGSFCSIKSFTCSQCTLSGSLPASWAFTFPFLERLELTDLNKMQPDNVTFDATIPPGEFDRLPVSNACKKKGYGS